MTSGYFKRDIQLFLVIAAGIILLGFFHALVPHLAYTALVFAAPCMVIYFARRAWYLVKIERETNAMCEPRERGRHDRRYSESLR